MASTEHTDILDEALKVISSLRKEGAHLHSITNTVAQNFTANVLLACGATVSMTANPQEIEDFISRANALHINLGTLDDDRMAAIRSAVKHANSASIPITLDPVMIHVSTLRREFALELSDKISIVRGNAAEIKCLRETIGGETCLVETGKTDQINHAGQDYEVNNGHPLMGKVIATGCALGALIGALSAKTTNPSTASLAALIWFSVAGEIAAEKATGPGSFQLEFLDALNSVTIEELKERAKVIL